jgi:hypothetical protein
MTDQNQQRNWTPPPGGNAPQSKSTERLGCIVIVVILLGLGVGYWITAFPPKQGGMPTIDATVMEAQAVSVAADGGQGFRGQVLLRYTVGGQDYFMWKDTEITASTPEAVERQVRRRVYHVSYNPANPGQAKLQ